MRAGKKKTLTKAQQSYIDRILGRMADLAKPRNKRRPVQRKAR